MQQYSINFTRNVKMIKKLFFGGGGGKMFIEVFRIVPVLREAGKHLRNSL